MIRSAKSCVTFVGLARGAFAPRLARQPSLAKRPCERRLERETGFEPATSTLARSHSTTELFPPCRKGILRSSPSRRQDLGVDRPLPVLYIVGSGPARGGVAKWLRRRSAKPLLSGSNPLATSMSSTSSPTSRGSPETVHGRANQAGGSAEGDRPQG